MAFLKSSRITGISARDVAVRGFRQVNNIKLGTRAYTRHEVLLADSYSIVGDVTVSDNLILSKLSDDGDDITITGDTTTRTISGSGSIEGATLAQTPNATLTGMTGTLGSAVTGGSGITALGTVASGTIGTGVTFPTGKFIPLKDIAHSNGSTSASGSNVDMLSTGLDLAPYEGYLLYGWGHTAISENSNTANTTRIRLLLSRASDGASVAFAAARQGAGAYSVVSWDTNTTVHISCQGYFVVTAAYAQSCTLKLNGGIDGSAFSWGDQGSYSSFDGETPQAGATLGFLLFHP